jgi:hypothetical protein
MRIGSRRQSVLKQFKQMWIRSELPGLLGRIYLPTIKFLKRQSTAELGCKRRSGRGPHNQFGGAQIDTFLAQPEQQVGHPGNPCHAAASKNESTILHVIPRLLGRNLSGGVDRAFSKRYFPRRWVQAHSNLVRIAPGH